MGQAASDSRVNHTTLTIADGAYSGHTTSFWDQSSDPDYDRVRDTILAPQGRSEAQVQVVWIKEANPAPQVSLPAANAEAYVYETGLGNVLRAAKARYPNLKIAYISSRIYAGYAGFPPPPDSLNPEPYAYEYGFSLKWLIEAQINQMSGGPVDPTAGDLNYNTVMPWVSWGPYMWADGTNPRSDGLVWNCSDLSPNDGTHPSMSGQQKVGTMLLNFMLHDRSATHWFRNCELGDMNHDGLFDAQDIAAFITTVLNPTGSPAALRCAADCNEDGFPSLADISSFVDILLRG